MLYELLSNHFQKNVVGFVLVFCLFVCSFVSGFWAVFISKLYVKIKQVLWTVEEDLQHRPVISKSDSMASFQRTDSSPLTSQDPNPWSSEFQQRLGALLYLLLRANSHRTESPGQHSRSSRTRVGKPNWNQKRAQFIQPCSIPEPPTAQTFHHTNSRG